MKTFDLAISLGSACQTRYNISRTYYRTKFGTYAGFDSKSPPAEKFDYGSFYFDWSISPIDSVIAILQDRFSGDFRLEDLSIFEQAGGSKSVLNLRNKCQYPHLLEGFDKKICQESLDENFSAIKEKYRYLADKTLQAMNSSKRILFVLNGNHARRSLENLEEALQGYPCKSAILYLPVKGRPEFSTDQQALLDSSIWIVRPVLHKPYPGDLNSWASAFEEIQLITP